MNRYSLAAGVAALSIVLASCSSSKTDKKAPASSAPGVTTSAAATSSAPAPATGGIIIKDFAFTGTLTAKPGEKVTVTNMDSTPHTVTDKGGKFNSGKIDGGGGTGSFTAPTAPGSYSLKCTFHAEMSGTLVVG
ncbi:MAG: metal-binding protein [Pseudonocardiales bacterium]|nr:MAG: metal-binding protein [Pseudonocardiales bacterium]